MGGLEASTLMERDPNMGKEKVVSNSTLLPSSTKGFKDKGIPNNSMPSWLLTNISDLEERMKVLAMSTTEDEEMGDTFADRAETYYQKRPQLLSLLQDLYNGYITLSDRYIQTLAKHKHHSRHSSQVSTVDEGFSDQEEEASGVSHSDSDIESSISYQHPQHMMMPIGLPKSSMLDVDAIVAELLIRNIEYDMLMHEVGVMERRYCESSRKSELQKSLLEVLESERIVLLNENASLGYRVNTLVEENKELASESVFIKRKAGELAKCVLKMREDHRVYLLHRKIEDLQAQIHALEKRNKEYYDKLLRRDGHEDGKKGVALEVCVQMDKQKRFKWKDGNTSGMKKFHGKKSPPSLWKKLKNMDLLLCGTNPTCA
ncbi:kinase-interacting family protein-like isoform X1 [Glycine max]|uniref:kinase-interacting family protein-like isoform X1 n=1 Tax=Glycine max TaxID=3847 RepID=UPI0007192834|nr:kinase-interacting family protein-like isoform X1 [Glycine max]|eukprot:XP_014617696.1 kinase-interacting family protein-like isoform X1 [Glycine max]